MAQAKSGDKKGPSSRLMEMKFMQRSVEKEKLKELEKERKRIISEAEWYIDYDTADISKPKLQVEHQPSFLAFSTTVPGRTSFQDFNKPVAPQTEFGNEQQETDEQKPAKSLRELSKKRKTPGDKGKAVKQPHGPSSSSSATGPTSSSSSSSKKQKFEQNKSKNSRNLPQPTRRGFIKPE
ncbi:hypothetical protein BCR43DRAFT_498101 [Syncephalastrum racemosum]|uniref:M-phase phosphoprotein 6 n=1 Tax=Syncephalastrum racemosum TaxID=13706 RepID=A0A1X2H3B4_SYNRA|nr:hypothetical protein BCR43DRAFT_498101 [Syncephalastrum racemosum]